VIYKVHLEALARVSSHFRGLREDGFEPKEDVRMRDMRTVPLLSMVENAAFVTMLLGVAHNKPQYYTDINAKTSWENHMAIWEAAHRLDVPRLKSLAQAGFL